MTGAVMRLVTVAEMRAIEKEGNASGVSYAEMMERAGRGVAQVVHHTYGLSRPGGVVGLVGSGNNGGDTLVALETLAGLGWRVKVALVRPRPENDPYLTRVIQARGEVLAVDTDANLEKLEHWLG